MFEKPNRFVNRTFIHCSASDNPKHDNAFTMETWHRQRGWSGIGYHYFIRKDGTLEKGRNLETTPAAQYRHNRGTIAICLHGLREELFTDEQFNTLRKLVREIDDAYRGKMTYHGHCEVSNKSCPVFNYKRVLGLSGKGKLL